MPNVIRILRSLTDGTRPTAKTEGEPYINFANKSFGVVDDAAVAQDLIAVRFFSTASTYAVGDFVIEAGGLYACSTAVAVAGPFDPADWTATGIAPDLSGYLQLAGGVMVGQISLPLTAPVAAQDATPKAYVDALRQDVIDAGAAQALLFLPIAGGDLTGPLGGTTAVFTGEIEAAEPTVPESLTTKFYVDTVDADLQAQISVLASNLIYSGSIAVQTDVGDYTPESGMADGPLPTAAAAGANKYVIVTDGGTPAAGEIPAGAYAAADWLVSGRNGVDATAYRGHGGNGGDRAQRHPQPRHQCLRQRPSRAARPLRCQAGRQLDHRRRNLLMAILKSIEPNAFIGAGEAIVRSMWIESTEPFVAGTEVVLLLDGVNASGDRELMEVPGVLGAPEPVPERPNRVRVDVSMEPVTHRGTYIVMLRDPAATPPMSPSGLQVLLAA